MVFDRIAAPDMAGFRTAKSVPAPTKTDCWGQGTHPITHGCHLSAAKSEELPRQNNNQQKRLTIHRTTKSRILRGRSKRRTGIFFNQAAQQGFKRASRDGLSGQFAISARRASWRRRSIRWLVSSPFARRGRRSKDVCSGLDDRGGSCRARDCRSHPWPVFSPTSVYSWMSCNGRRKNAAGPTTIC